MDAKNTDPRWRDIEIKLDWPGARRFARRKILPLLEPVKMTPPGKNGQVTGLKLPMLLGFGAFIAVFAGFKMLLPQGGIFEVLTFIIFPLLFISCMMTSAFLFRGRIAALFVDGKDRFLIRSEVLGRIARETGMDYVPMPGGPSASLKAFAEWKYCPQTLKDMVQIMDDHGGFDAEADIVRQTGLTLSSEIVLASEENYRKYYDQQVKSQQFEDGFKGTRNGLSFSALEWALQKDESTEYHLFLLLKLPTYLTGFVDIKSKAASWPIKRPDCGIEAVSLVSSKFTKQFNVRAADQMEARLIFDPAVMERLMTFSHDAPIRAVAYEDNLVFDICGPNRFNLVDLLTGEWSEETILSTFEDITEMFALIDEVAGVFNVKAERKRA